MPFGESVSGALASRRTVNRRGPCPNAARPGLQGERGHWGRAAGARTGCLGGSSSVIGGERKEGGRDSTGLSRVVPCGSELSSEALAAGENKEADTRPTIAAHPPIGTKIKES